MPAPTPARPPWPDHFTAWAGIATSLTLGYAALSLQLPPPAGAQVVDAGMPAPALLQTCAANPAGYWRGSITGSATLELDWQGAGLACAGGARPDGRGLRLFFAGHPGGGGERLVIVLGIAATVAELAGREWPVSVTVIDEASSSFFHSIAGRCFTRVTEVTALDRQGRAFRVAGELYCAGALGAVNGEHAVQLGDSRYAGHLDLEVP